MGSLDIPVTMNVTKISYSDVLRGLAAKGAGKRRLQKTFLKADLIMVEDVDAGGRAVFYGKELLEDIIAGRGCEFTETKELLCIAVDASDKSTDLDMIAAMVTVLRGSCCYGS